MFKKIWKWVSLALAGAFMSVSDIVPGFSGGIALTLTGKIKDVWKKWKLIFKPKEKGDRKKAILFYIVFILGAIGGVFGFAQIVKLALVFIPEITYWFFLTLGFAAVLIYWNLNGINFFDKKEKNKKIIQKISIKKILFTLLGILMISSITIIAWNVGIDDALNLKKDNKAVIKILDLRFLFMCIAGFFASAAMVTPGMSGALVIVAFGVYPDIYGKMFSNPIENIWALLIYGSMTVFGTVFSVVIMERLYSKFKTFMTYLFFGTIIASIGAMIFVFHNYLIPKNEIWWIYISIAIALAFSIVLIMFKYIKYEKKQKHNLSL